jgi:predicted membrane-bound mannosyltransferase
MKETGDLFADQPRFDAKEGRQRRDAAMAVSEVGKDVWMVEATQAVLAVARAEREFTTDSVWKRGLPPCPGSRRALGPVMVAVARTDRTRPTAKAESHAQPLRIWSSKIYAGDV